MPTLTDSSCINTFVNEMRFTVLPKWSHQSASARALAMHGAIGRVLKSCGVPDTTGEAAALGGSNGLFDFPTWKIKMNTALFPDVELDPNNIHPYFVSVCEIMYHEARHCEQWWHMARFAAQDVRSPSNLSKLLGKPMLAKMPPGSPVVLQEGGAYVARTMGIPRTVARAAMDKPMGGADPMLALTKDWWKSVYGESNRGTVLNALMLKRRNVPGETAVLLNAFRADIHANYSGVLPEEIDAWGIQPLVRAAFVRYQRP